MEWDSSSNVSPRIHGIRQIRAKGPRLDRQVLLPTEEYIHNKTISGALRVLCAIIALVWAAVALFITGLASADKVLIERAKIGVITATLITAMAGYVYLLLISRAQKENHGTRDKL